MRYEEIYQAEFLDRPNRFLAHCRLEGRQIVCHVKNTGRCRELLVPGATVYVQHHEGGARKTSWSLIAVEKGARLVNIDSQAPNRVAREALEEGRLDALLGAPARQVKSEVAVGGSRLDLTALAGERQWFIEIKGVTLEREGLALFPDAPTERGRRHLEELTRLRQRGYGALALFVVQMEGVARFAPNEERDPAFAQALRRAVEHGVTAAAFSCRVAPDMLALWEAIPLML